MMVNPITDPNVDIQNLDTEFLKTWIQPQHLENQAILATRAGFEAHPAHIARIPRFLHEEMAEKLATLPGNDVQFDRVSHLYSQKNRNVPDAEFHAAPTKDRPLTFSQMADLTLNPDTKPGLNLLFYVKFKAFFFDPRFLSYVRALTGLLLAKPSSFVANALGAGDFIAAHNDIHQNAQTRRLAFILYLCPTWQPEFGGALGITGHSGEVSRWEVEWNSFAFFDVIGHRDHEVEPILEAAGTKRRISFDGWFSGIESQHMTSSNPI